MSITFRVNSVNMVSNHGQIGMKCLACLLNGFFKLSPSFDGACRCNSIGSLCLALLFSSPLIKNGPPKVQGEDF